MILGAFPSGVCLGGISVAAGRGVAVTTIAVGDEAVLQDMTPTIIKNMVSRNIILLPSFIISLYSHDFSSHSWFLICDAKLIFVLDGLETTV